MKLTLLDVAPETDWMEKARIWFADNPHNFGLLLAFVGLVLLIGTIRKWGWVLEIKVGWIGKALYRKYGDRFVITYMYVFSILLIILGLSWYFIYILL